MTVAIGNAVQGPDWDACRAVAQQHGRSFFLASRLLQGDRRRAILAAYAFCRLADDIVDQANGDPAQTDWLLDDWERQLANPAHPVAVAFAQVREQYGIPDSPIHELFLGLRKDLTINRYQSWGELREYCYLVAGTVGLIVAPILGCSDPAALSRAAELGIAMQLTNILRDIGEDAALGRLYLPLQELDSFGIDADRVMQGTPGPAFPVFMQFQIARARELYQYGLTGVTALCPSGRLTTLAAAQLYAGILGQIEANNFDVFTCRAVVPRSGKVRHGAAAIGRFVGMSCGLSRSRRVNQAPVPSTSAEPEVEGWVS
jgi:phytoene synthase